MSSQLFFVRRLFFLSQLTRRKCLAAKIVLRNNRLLKMKLSCKEMKDQTSNRVNAPGHLLIYLDI